MIRGLTMFISDIRNCKTTEQEQTRVKKELAKIRKTFAKKRVDGYTKKKYLWKILYMYMLGYDVDFGHMEAVNLITSNKYSEKQVGYMALSVLLIEHADLLRLCIQSIRNDLLGKNDIFQCMALTAVANVGEQEMAESLAADVQKLLVNKTSRNFVRKKAALCLLRLFRKFPEIIQADSWAPRCLDLMDHGNIGVVTSVMSLLLGLVRHSYKGYEDAVPRAIRLLVKFTLTRECAKEYLYYRTPCPWLQVKLLTLLQYFPPPSDETEASRLHDILEKVLKKTEVTKSVNKNNADHAILFEAVNVIIHLNLNGSHTLHNQAIIHLSRFISVREPNIRYLGLETMAKLAQIPGTLNSIKRHQNTIQYSLKDTDISIRKRALDLLYQMCDKTNSKEIVTDLLTYLTTAEFTIREEMVLKIAILAEKYSPDPQWYVDVILKLITIAGDFVTEDIWYRVVQIVTNNEELQLYAAQMMFEALGNTHVHENAVKVAGYILGEFGHLLENISGVEQFEALHGHFAASSPAAQALLLSTFMKMANMYEDIVDDVAEVFEIQQESANSEIQQRAVEYGEMLEHEDQTLINTIWEAMPDFPDRDSLLEKADGLGPGKRFDDDEDKEDSDWSDEEVDEESQTESDYSEEEEDEKATPGGDVSGTESDASDASVTSGEGEESTDDDENVYSDEELDEGPPVGLIDLPGFSTDSGAPTVPQDPELLASLLSRTSGVLYESETIQVGVKMKFENGHLCKMILYYGNHHPNEPIKDFICKITSSSGLQVQIKPDDLFDVAPKKQTPQYLMIRCTQPYQELPTIGIRFTLEGQLKHLSLQLPIAVSKFIIPWACSMQEFVAEWKADGEERECKFVFKSRMPIDVEQLRTTLEGMGCFVHPPMANSPGTLVISSIFHTASKAPTGEFRTFKFLLRLETSQKAQMFRATIRSSHSLVSDAMKSAFQLTLGASS